MNLYVFVYDDEKHETIVAACGYDTDESAARAAKRRLKARTTDKNHEMQVWRGTKADYAAERAELVDRITIKRDRNKGGALETHQATF